MAIKVLDFRASALVEGVTFAEAAAITGFSHQAIRLWASADGFVFRCMGRYLVSRVGLRLRLARDFEALKAFSSGDFADQRVSAAYAAEGLPLPRDRGSRAAA